jgi:Aldehyde dehydrogenase family
MRVAGAPSPEQPHERATAAGPTRNDQLGHIAAQARPALAVNAVVPKPARTVPLTALAQAARFVDAGLAAGVLLVLTGPGGTPWRRASRRPPRAPDLHHRLDRYR